ncbi:MAG TPA: hypothetical protein V6D48_10665 [Oculatellaceae cyanobacterium]
MSKSNRTDDFNVMPKLPECDRFVSPDSVIFRAGIWATAQRLLNWLQLYA